MVPLDTIQLDQPGVYVALDGAKVVYVGQSKHIKQRRGQHVAEKSKKWAQNPKLRWVGRPIAGGVEARLVAETALILRYRPRANKAIKIGLKSTGTIYELSFLRGRGKPKW